MTKTQTGLMALVIALAAPAAFAQTSSESDAAAAVRKVGTALTEGAADLTDTVGEAITRGVDQASEAWEEVETNIPNVDEPQNTPFVDAEDGGFVSQIINASIYDANGNATQYVSDVPDGWEMVGVIGDVLISSEGQVKGYLVDIGSFMRGDEKNVIIDVNALTPINIGTDTAYVINIPKSNIETLPDVETLR